ncbi:peptide-N4-asparagine amidase [Frateuria sp.]|uniref:peptide-N4-asparagine amidase n=1 Tax=Frateuria sp. TaxID=2211372 RepID=UPI002D7E2BF5|nr:peptide-N4-asparagine amidase [Frateuria sp.]
MDPPVPVPAGQPCVVHLFEQLDVANEYTYSPPAACPPPWSKVILKVDLTGTRFDSGARIDLDDVTLFAGATPGSTHETSWHAERDLTDYTALFKQFHWGLFQDLGTLEGGTGDSSLKGSAALEFYPATPATPAPRVPDAVYSAEYLPEELPHNIERAYVDVYAVSSWWYTAAPAETFSKYPALNTPLAAGGEVDDFSVNPPREGYAGSAYREMWVSVDNQRAGLAPVFPLLPAAYNWALPYMLEDPAPSLQRLNFTPWRVDITPFVGILNEAGEHRVDVDWGNQGAQLLVYLDKGSTHVGGAVTQNTLQSQPGSPTIENGLAPDGDALKGTVVTRSDRDFTISGVAYTSHGPVQTTVHQTQRLRNTQTFDVEGLEFPDWRSYRQDVDLQSTVDRETTISQANHVLSRDVVHASYPLNLHYRMDALIDAYDVGWDMYVTGAEVGATQARTQTRDYDGHGAAHYASRLADTFSAVRERDANGADTSWFSATSRGFWDDAGSCRTAALGTRDGVVEARVEGVGCPDGQNRTSWLSHPDGSFDGLGWLGQ